MRSPVCLAASPCRRSRPAAAPSQSPGLTPLIALIAFRRPQVPTPPSWSELKAERTNDRRRPMPCDRLLCARAGKRGTESFELGSPSHPLGLRIKRGVTVEGGRRLIRRRGGTAAALGAERQGRNRLGTTRNNSGNTRNNSEQLGKYSEELGTTREILGGTREILGKYSEELGTESEQTRKILGK